MLDGGIAKGSTERIGLLTCDALCALDGGHSATKVHGDRVDAHAVDISHAREPRAPQAFHSLAKALPLGSGDALERTLERPGTPGANLRDDDKRTAARDQVELEPSKVYVALKDFVPASEQKVRTGNFSTRPRRQTDY